MSDNLPESTGTHHEQARESVQKVYTSANGSPLIYERPVSNFLYVLTDGEFVKVGISTGPAERVRTLQSGNARRITLLRTYRVEEYDARYVEQSLHQLLFLDRQQGEWFSCDPEDVDDLFCGLYEDMAIEPPVFCSYERGHQ